MGENREIDSLEIQMKLNKYQRVPNQVHNAQEQFEKRAMVGELVMFL